MYASALVRTLALGTSVLRRVALILCAVVSLTACDGIGRKESPPADGILAENAVALLQQAGLIEEASQSRVVGRHYEPAFDQWRVIICIDATFTGGNTRTDCNDAYRVYRLDTGKWIISGQFDSIYRWREIPSALP